MYLLLKTVCRTFLGKMLFYPSTTYCNSISLDRARHHFLWIKIAQLLRIQSVRSHHTVPVKDKDVQLVTDQLKTADNNTALSIKNKVASVFMSKSVSEAETSAGYLVAHIVGHKTWYYVDKTTALSPTQIAQLVPLVAARLAHAPIQYVLGEWDFWDISLRMAPPVLIPRPETEELVGHVLQDARVQSAQRFLEIGCGSGAICLSLLKALPRSQCVAVDLSLAACELTLHNAAELSLKQRLKVHHASFNTDFIHQVALDSRFDFIVSNPPYIPTADMYDLQQEIISYEDHDALNGGADGMDLIRVILDAAPKLLSPHGSLWLEVDSTHPPLIEEHLRSHQHRRLTLQATHSDFRGWPRFCHISYDTS